MKFTENNKENALPKVDPFSLEFTIRPDSIYRHIRDIEPVYYMEDYDSWLILTHEDTKAAMANELLTMNRKDWAGYVEPDESQISLTPIRDKLGNNSPLTSPPEEHLKSRRILSKMFSPRAMERFKPLIEGVVNEYCEVFKKGRIVDIAPAIVPIPNVAMAKMMGVDSLGVRAEEFHEVARQYLKGVNPFLPEEELPSVEEGSIYVSNIFRELLVKRRESPKDDLVSDMIAAAEGEWGMTEDNLISLLTALLSVGSDTTVHQAILSIKTLLEHPEVFEALRQDRGLMDQTLEELLRFEGPGKLFPRFASEAMTIKGKQIKKGQIVFLNTIAANWDANAFENPDKFDIYRSGRKSLSFGHGVHFCIGAHLAKSEIKQIINCALDSFPKGTEVLADQINWHPEDFIFRSISHMPLDTHRDQ